MICCARSGFRLKLANRYPHQIAAGQQQRVGSLAPLRPSRGSWCSTSQSSSLDPTARAEIIDLLIDLQDRTGITYLFISHDLMTVRYLCNWVAVMYLGKIVEMSTTEELFENPVHPYTRGAPIGNTGARSGLRARKIRARG